MDQRAVQNGPTSCSDFKGGQLLCPCLNTAKVVREELIGKHEDEVEFLRQSRRPPRSGFCGGAEVGGD